MSKRIAALVQDLLLLSVFFASTAGADTSGRHCQVEV